MLSNLILGIRPFPNLPTLPGLRPASLATPFEIENSFKISELFRNPSVEPCPKDIWLEVEQGVVKPPLVYIFFLPLFNTQGFNKAHISKAFYRYLIKTGLVANFKNNS